MNVIEKHPNSLTAKHGNLGVKPVDEEALRKMIEDAIKNMNSRFTDLENSLKRSSPVSAPSNNLKQYGSGSFKSVSSNQGHVYKFTIPSDGWCVINVTPGNGTCTWAFLNLPDESVFRNYNNSSLESIRKYAVLLTYGSSVSGSGDTSMFPCREGDVLYFADSPFYGPTWAWNIPISKVLVTIRVAD